jgi:hypothetical protein
MRRIVLERVVSNVPAPKAPGDAPPADAPAADALNPPVGDGDLAPREVATLVALTVRAVGLSRG